MTPRQHDRIGHGITCYVMSYVYVVICPNRSSFATAMNDRSSRSHSILSVYVQGENKVAGITTSGKLHMIDLAGSERLSKSLAVGDRLKEAQAINKSLSALGNVIEALQKKSTHVPYRNSKLTFLLEDSLGNISYHNIIPYICFFHPWMLTYL
jgi:hypothetical protein